MTRNPYPAAPIYRGFSAHDAWDAGYRGASANYGLGTQLRRAYDEGRRARLNETHPTGEQHDH